MITKVAKIRRIAYDFQEVVEMRGARLELTYDTGNVELFDSAADGDSLRVETQRWEDPFAEPLSEENREWVEGYGKHVAVDVSSSDPYRALIGQALIGTDDLHDQWGKISGRVLHFERTDLTVRVQADELDVQVRQR